LTIFYEKPKQIYAALFGKKAAFLNQFRLEVDYHFKLCQRRKALMLQPHSLQSG
jgi:hypothetical protein